MLGESHDLKHEFPDLEQRILALRTQDESFAQQMDEYNMLDQRIREIEELGTPVTDETIEDLKKQRLQLKDTLYDKLRA